MTVEELRKAGRFLVVDPITGTFGPGEAQVLNLSVSGAQVSHPQPIRIGTVGRLAFRHGDVTVSTQARVLWSHLSAGPGGKIIYRTGLHIEGADAQYAMAINSLIRYGALRQDADSLDKKRQREIQREEKKKSGPKPIPSAR